VISKAQTTTVSLNPTHSEYNAFSVATEQIKFYRLYLAWLGYPQAGPTPLETDCAPAMSILEAPHFPRNSKTLLDQDHNVRAAYRDGILTPCHVQSFGFATDLNAKPFGPTDFNRKRSVLLNIKANPAVTPTLRIPLHKFVLSNLFPQMLTHLSTPACQYKLQVRNGRTD